MANQGHSQICSRLFLSADLVGSTARKQANAQATPTWVGEVLAFYQQFPYQLNRSLAQSVDRMVDKLGTFELKEPPALWKAVGDELIYTALVPDEHHVRVIVDAWMQASRRTEDNVLDKSAMDLKGGAWLATFPSPDRAVAVPLASAVYDPDMDPEVVNRDLLDVASRGPSETVRLDFLGPSIDIGFRVVSQASARRFTLSLEVAWALAVSYAHTNEVSPLYFAGETEMKGVWSGRGYPLLWLDTGNHHAAQAEVDLMSGLTRVPLDRVREMADKLHRSDHWPSAIYLPESTHAEFRRDLPRLEAEAATLSQVDDTSGEIPELNGDDGSDAPF